MNIYDIMVRKENETILDTIEANDEEDLKRIIKREYIGYKLIWFKIASTFGRW